MASKVTAAVAALALTVGSLSALGGFLVNHAADRKVCQTRTELNASVRGLVDDFLLSNPKVTKRQALLAEREARARFPVKPC